MKMQACAGCGNEEKTAITDSLTHGRQDDRQASEDTTKTKVLQTKANYTCPMHPEVMSPKRGACPKCGMALTAVKREGASASKAVDNGARTPKEMLMAKLKLMRAGKYKCCIVEPCNACVDHGGCNCKEAVKNGKPVCGECYSGWERGEGDVAGKSLKDIKRGHGH
jgi:hypothetical protein